MFDLLVLAYQCDLTRDPYAIAWAARHDEEHLDPDQDELVSDVVRTLERRGVEVDAEIQRAAEHWPMARLAATDRSVLRAAVAELLGRPGTPARAVIDEAIEIAKRYGSDESGGFVNGVLDRVARTLRPAEF
jgi:N utilization substance protein B